MAEFSLIDSACNLFERSSGCRLHRNPASQKCKVLALGRWQQTLQQEDIPLPYLKLTDHLDYLGCKLFANYTRTRKENGSEIRKKIGRQVNGWKSGKFMPLTSRPWSLNVYCLSKIWYRTACLDMLLGDSSAITSSIKSWLYQDLLLKPQEMMLYRHPRDGGLGLINIRARAMAILIHTFLTLAINPKFTPNLYLQALYKWHVIGERGITDPGRPPYFSNYFFELIRDVHTQSSLNIRHMTVKQWYTLLLENGVTHTLSDFSAIPVIIPSKLEANHLNVDVAIPYRLSRLFGLSPEQKSFLFKWLQGLLPTRERLFRVKKIQSPICLSCPGQIDNTEHIFLCSKYLHILGPIVQYVKTAVGQINYSKLAALDLQLSESLELPIVWLLARTLMIIWEDKITNKTITWLQAKAVIEADASLLKETRWKFYTLHNAALVLEEILRGFN